MKVAAILRGFPGLGRVIAGVELVREFQENHHAKCRIYSYLSGWNYIQHLKGVDVRQIGTKNLSCVGIVPVSVDGEALLDELEDWQPDIFICDGEPLLTRELRILFPSCEIIVLLNPFDLDNPNSQLSTRLFFSDYFSNADIAIVHGLKEVKESFGFKKLYSINTILRPEVLSLSHAKNANNISCILGGGSQYTDDMFIESTLQAAQNCARNVIAHRNEHLNIYCSSQDIANRLDAFAFEERITIHPHLATPSTLFKDTNLCIVRGGRNTLSEVLYLGIPTLAFASSGAHRGSEQLSNIKRVETLSKGKICSISSCLDKEEFLKSTGAVEINVDQSVDWSPGNMALGEILN
jgi:hypothetical protein